MAFGPTTLAGRVFLLIISTVGMTLAFAGMKLDVVAGVVVVLIPFTALASRSITQPIDAFIAVARNTAIAGCLDPVFPENSPFQELNCLAEALNGAAKAIRHSQADLDGAYLEFVETMAQALDARDPYTAGHSLRVADYAHAIACEMGLRPKDVETIRVAAQLHDIGKIGIPDAVLQKPGRLTPEEYGLIKLHPQIGRRILEKVGRFANLLDVIELHHENHDGTGYPYRLSGDRIPVQVRIVHVADAFDAMTTDRSYRDALTVAQATEEIRTHSGSQFDPTVVGAFLKLRSQGKVGAEQGLWRASEQPVPVGAGR